MIPSPPTLRIGLALILLTVLLPQAQAGEVVLRVDRASMAVGGSVQAEVEVRGKADGGPSLPASKGLEVTRVGQSSNFTMSQGRVEQSTTFLYRIAASRPGEFQLGPASASVDGKRTQSEPVIIRALQPSRSGASAGKAGAGSDSASSVAKRSGDAFAVATVSDEDPFVGESLIYALEVGFAVRVRAPNWNQPNWGALTPEPGVDQIQLERPEVINGRRYDINTVLVPLFGVETGPTTIPAAELEVGIVERGFGLFNSTRAMQLQTDPVVLNLQPLPTNGRPDDFSGAVGQFRLKGHLDRTQVEAGETVTWTLELSGKGAIRGVELPSPEVTGLRLYDEEPEISSQLSADGLRSKATYRRALVPLEPGVLEIPAIHFTFFDPESERYTQTSAGPYRLDVTGEAVRDPAVLARSTSLARAKEEVEILGSDILPLHLGRQARGLAQLTLSSPAILALLLLPSLLFAGVASQSHSHRKAGTERGQKMARKKEAKQARARAKAAAKTSETEAAEAALRAYLGAQLDRSGDTLSPQELPPMLEQAGLDAETANRCAEILERYEALRFGGGSPDGLAEDVHNWVEAAESGWAS